MAEQGSPPAISIERTDFVSVPVKDLDRAKHFYSDVLGMAFFDDPEGNALMLDRRYAPQGATAHA